MWLAAGGAAAAATLMLLLPDIPREFLQRFMHDAPLQTKLLGRADIWASALKGIADHPFAGIGPGALNQVLPVRYPYGVVGLGYTVTQAHNIVLDTALTMGVVGAIGVVCALTGGIWWGVRHARMTPLLGVPATCARAFTAPLVTFAVFGMTDALSFSSPSSLLFWASLAGLLWATRSERASTDHLAKGPGGGGQRDHGQAGRHGEGLPHSGPVPSVVDEGAQGGHQVAYGVELGHGVEPVGKQDGRHETGGEEQDGEGYEDTYQHGKFRVARPQGDHVGDARPRDPEEHGDEYHGQHARDPCLEPRPHEI